MRTTRRSFVIGATALVTVRYRDCDSFELFARKLGRSATLSLKPDALAAGLDGVEAFEFSRTASRLTEMRSRDYLAEPHAAMGESGDLGGLVET